MSRGDISMSFATPKSFHYQKGGNDSSFFSKTPKSQKSLLGASFSRQPSVKRKSMPK